MCTPLIRYLPPAAALFLLAVLPVLAWAAPGQKAQRRARSTEPAALSLGLTRDLNTGVVALSATSGLLQLGFALMARGWVGAQAHEAGLKPFEASR